VKLIISEQELVTRTNIGRPSLCRICYDVKKKIVMVDYDTVRKKEILWSVCDDCQQVTSQCGSCKKNQM